MHQPCACSSTTFWLMVAPHRGGCKVYRCDRRAKNYSTALQRDCPTIANPKRSLLFGRDRHESDLQRGKLKGSARSATCARSRYAIAPNKTLAGDDMIASEVASRGTCTQSSPVQSYRTFRHSLRTKMRRSACGWAGTVFTAWQAGLRHDRVWLTSTEEHRTA